MGASLTGLAPAKINLALHITGQRDDGYHLLDSLVVFADVGDVLTVTPADQLTLTVSGPMAAGVPVDGRNLVLKAAQRLAALRGVTVGAAITLDKHLPHGAGIGGGSSDAASAIRLLARLWGVPPLTGAEALPLGADLPVCIAAPAPMRMQGVGEVLSAVPDLPPGWLVLVNPGVHVSTADIFRHHDFLYGITPLPLELFDPSQESLTTDDFQMWMLGQRNELTKVAAEAEFAPVVTEILQCLRALPECLDCDMSGSGSTCWGWFEREEDARAAAASFADRPGWWTAAARVLGQTDQLIRETT